MAYVQVDLEVDDYLDEASTKALQNELASRTKQGEKINNDNSREWQLLADMIARGEKAEALQLLSELSPHDLNSPATTLLLSNGMGGQLC